MFPSMFRCGILLLSVAALTLGTPPMTVDEGTQTSDDDQKQDSALDMSDVCFFGSPSFLCYLRCGQQNMRPVCEELQGLCVCMPVEDEAEDQSGDNQTENTTQSPQNIASGGGSNGTDNDDNKLHVIFYIFDIGSLFGDYNETRNATDIVNVTDIYGTVLPMDDVTSKLEVETMKGWASTHVLAMIIVALLCVLILVELAACLKKQNAKHKEANLFTASLGIPNKS